jgi:hypothetical protein
MRAFQHCRWRSDILRLIEHEASKVWTGVNYSDFFMTQRLSIVLLSMTDGNERCRHRDQFITTKLMRIHGSSEIPLIVVQ